MAQSADPVPYGGAILETLGELANDSAAHARWRTLVTRMSGALGWPARAPVIRVCAGTSMLALFAPPDQLMLATDVNEWAWEMAVGLIGMAKPATAATSAAAASSATAGTSTAAANLATAGTMSSALTAPDQAVDPLYAGFDALHAGLPDFASALNAFAEKSASQHNPLLLALLTQAQQRQLPVLQDDDCFTIGTGKGARTWPLAALPAPDTVPWHALGRIPAILVSGTNGKTTSVRLLAAMAKQAGQHPAWCCTEGVYVDGVQVESGDYSGPGGARTALRQPGVDFAVLEMARGGILRRGLALDQAEVALLTNVTPEHFGEYGIDNLSDLADAKLVLAQALGQAGTLVVNADDPVLLARAAATPCQRALFALDFAHPALQAMRKAHRPCCGGHDGHLLLAAQGMVHDLGDIAAMPLTLKGSAHYNIANAAGAALAAFAIGIAPEQIAQVLARFGQSRHDNPGRLEHWQLADLNVLLDYAHNPEGLSGLLTVAHALRDAGSGIHPAISRGRIGLLLGQAGNRSNEAIADLAAMAAQCAPDRIVLKDIPGYMRGRAVGEVPALLLAQLLKSGYDPASIETILPETDAALDLLRWAQAGDVLVLPVHDSDAKLQMQTLLDRLQDTQWYCGQALPAVTAVPTLAATPELPDTATAKPLIPPPPE